MSTRMSLTKWLFTGLPSNTRDFLWLLEGKYYRLYLFVQWAPGYVTQTTPHLAFVMFKFENVMANSDEDRLIGQCSECIWLVTQLCPLNSWHSPSMGHIPPGILKKPLTDKALWGLHLFSPGVCIWSSNQPSLIFLSSAPPQCFSNFVSSHFLYGANSRSFELKIGN